MIHLQFWFGHMEGEGLLSISQGGRGVQMFTYLYLRASDTNTEKVAMSTDCRSLDSGTNILSVRSRALFSVTPWSVPPVQVSPGGSAPGCSPSSERGGSAGTERSRPSSQSSPPSRRRTTPPSSSPQVCRCSSTCWRTHRYERTPLRPLTSLSSNTKPSEISCSSCNGHQRQIPVAARLLATF